MKSKNIEDIYALSPLQEGMLFHSLYAPETGVYVVQSAYRLENLEVDAFWHAWTLAMERHAVLRTAFVWKATKRLLQVVGRTVTLPAEEHDWSDLEPAEQDRRFEALLAADRERPFALHKAPLMRLVLVRQGPTTFDFLWSHHHLMLDGWSVRSLLQEVFTLYDARLRGVDAPLGAVRPFRDYIAWLGRQDEAEAKRFWASTLEGFEGAEPLPMATGGSPGSGRPASAVFGEERLELPGIGRALERWAQQRRLTMATVIQGAWALVTSRYTRSADVTFGSVVSGRPAELTGVEEMIGLFINTLPSRVSVPGNGRVEEWLTALQVQHMDVRRFGHCSLAQIRRWVGLDAEQPLFETLVVFENYPSITSDDEGAAPAVAGARPGLRIEEIQQKEQNNYPLTLVASNRGGVSMRLDYDPSHYDRASCRRLLGHLRSALEAFVDNDRQRLDAISILTATERDQLIRRWGRPWGRCEGGVLPYLFAAQAAQRGTAEAVSFEGQRRTWRDLAEASHRLAHFLRRQGVRRGDRVGLCLERGMDLVVAILATLEAGAAYVPLDPRLPAERLEFLLTDAGVGLIIGRGDLERYRQTLPELALLDLGVEADSIAAEVPEPLGVPLDGSDVAYVIYTSGSTGKPKGVPVTHDNVVRLFRACEEPFGTAFGPDDVWTLFHSYAFDFSVWELWGALLYGGRLVVVPHMVSRQPEAFWRLLVEEGVTVLSQTPSAFRQLSAVALADPEASSASALRWVVFGGEALQLASLRPWLQHFGEDAPQLVNMYGITETTVHVTFRRVGSAEIEAGAGSLIGRPLPDLGIHLLGATLEPVPLGIPGEIFVTGGGLAQGYLGRPALTAERFVPNPFGETPGARLYRSGDLARRLDTGDQEHGDLEYLGRLDHQVKVRGFRIELGEIEAALLVVPTVAEAVVLADAAGGDTARLVAYVVAVPDASPTVADLRAELSRVLPEYMVPASFILLDALPLTANGKLDRGALPAPDAAPGMGLGGVYQAPRTDQEKRLVEIFQAVLGVERVGITDDFFALGGDSIRSIQVLAQAERAGIPLTLPQLFAHPTIEALAALDGVAADGPATVDDPTAAEGARSVSADRPMAVEPVGLLDEADRSALPEDIEDAYPLTRLQSGMVFHSELSEGATTYHDVFSYHLEAAWDPGAMAKALRQITERHPVLRTSLDLTGFGEPLQRVHRTVEPWFEEEDLSALDAAEQEQHIAAWIEAEKARPFDWRRPPLIRFQVHRRSADSIQLTLSFHHAILDGWSVASLLTELFRFYRAARGLETPLPEPVHATFREFVARERESLASESTREFWRRQLAGVEASRVTTSSAAEAAAGRRHGVPLPPAVSSGLVGRARALGVPLKSVLLTAHCHVLGLFAGHSTVTTGLVSHGRAEDDGERVLGLFLNTPPFVCALSGDSWGDAVRRVFDQERALLPHLRFPLAELQRWRDGEPLFEAAFNFVHFHVYRQVEQYTDVRLVGGQAFEETNFPLTANFSLGGEDQVELSLSYDPSQLSEQRVEDLATAYGRALTALVETPSRAPRAGDLLEPNERLQRARAWEGPRAEIPLPDLGTRLAEQAITRSDAMAVVMGEERWTYGQLMAAADRLAARLRGFGVGPEDRVAVCCARSPELVVALVGVLRSGAAYVPIDPSLPARRRGLMLEGSRVAALVTDGTAGVDIELQAEVPRVPVLDAGAGVEAYPGGSPAMAEHLAYILYTSGTTGRPKGVAVTHGGLAHYLTWAIDHYGVHPGDASVVHTSIGFDLTITSLFVPLAAGGVVHLVPEDGGVEALGRVLDSIDGEVLLKLTPSHLAFLAGELSPQTASRVRCLVVGGEALFEETLADWRRLAPQTRIVNEYGPTETVVGCVVHTAESAEATGPVPIGGPIARTRLRLVDAALDPTPAGVPGHLAIGGAGVARGYFDQPRLTAERFIPDPFATEPGARLYLSGDRVVDRDGGTLVYLGRMDAQVKIRGHRIEPAEIEAVLLAQAGVREAVVVQRRLGDDEALVAYVVGLGEGLDGEGLRRLVSEELPAWMVPAVIMGLESLPTTRHGKVDRDALPQPERRSAVTVSRPPRTPTEEMLLELWGQVLGTRELGIDHGFFQLGGHSLLATQLISRVREAFSIEVSLRSLFDAPTVATFATVVESARRKQGGLAVLPPLEAGPRDAARPLSFAQERLWFLHQMEPEGTAYNVPVALWIRGALDLDLLDTALDQVFERHDVLRSLFVALEEDDTGFAVEQQRVPVGDIERQRLDLTDHPADGRREAALGLAREEAARPFTLAQAPPVRVLTVALGPEEHLLVLTLHHIVSDGWSIGILAREVGQLYGALADGLPSPLEPLAVQYADYAEWQRSWLSGEVLEQQIAFWRRTLDPASDFLHLPTDRPRPNRLEHRGGSCSMRIEAPVSEALERLGRRTGTTLFMQLLAAFAVQLGRLGRTTHPVIGTPIAGRRHGETEGLLGLFVNTLPLAVDLRGNPSFEFLLQQVRETTLDAYDHQDLPFEKLVEELAPVREVGRTPIFQVMLVVQNLEVPSVETGALVLEPVHLPNPTTKFDLTVAVEQRAEGLAVALQYSVDLFDESTTSRLLSQWSHILEAAAEDPGLAVDRLPLLSESERHQLLYGWNATDRPGPSPESPRTVFTRFWQQVEERPGAPALYFHGESQTYGEIGRRVEQFGDALAALGVGRGDLVALWVERSPWMVVALLAIWRRGAAVVPIDRAQPVARVWALFAEARPGWVILDRPISEDPGEEDPWRRLDEAPTRIPLDDLRAARGFDTPEAPVAVCGRDLAYVIFTSGSTGRPKGVLVEHHGLDNYLAYAQRVFPFAEGRPSTLHTSIGFDLCLTVLLGPLVSGAPVILTGEDSALEDLAEAFRGPDALGVIKLTPSHLVALEPDATADWRAPAALMVGGEQLTGELLTPWLERWPDLRCFNHYGPTEATIGCCVNPIQGPVPPGPVPIGLPIDNTQLHVLDPHMEPLPLGAIGRLYIAGAGLCRGYLGRPGSTAQRLLPNPFSSAPGERLYDTGDLALRRADGTIGFVGRVDNQVKIRGHRIETGEVEAALRRHPAVETCAVVKREDTSGLEALVAYVVLDDTAVELEVSELRGFLAGHLLPAMIPTRYVALDELPLNRNGKLDQKRLPAPSESADVGRGSVAPRTPLEAQIAEVWAEVLGLEEVGVEDDFFTLGGHSLLATRAVARLRRALDADLSLRLFFEAPTVAALAQRLANPEATKVQMPPIQRIDRGGELPLSFAQERLWFLEQLEPGSLAYSMPRILELRGSLDPRALGDALDDLRRRHEVLRTVFPQERGRPHQSVEPFEPQPLKMHDFSDLEATLAEDAARDLLASEVGRPFDLAVGPLVRTALVRLAEERHLLLLSMHHILADGWSAEILERDLTTLYRARVEGRDGHAELPPLPIQYADYAVWQRRWLRDETLDGEIDFWRRYLAGAPPILELPVDRPRRLPVDPRGASCGVVLDAGVSERLRALGAAAGASPFMAVLTGFGAFLARYSSQSDLVVGTPIAGREPLETEPLIGLFLETLALRLPVSGSAGFTQALRAVRDSTLEAFAHPHLPFEKLVDALGVPRSPETTPVFQVMMLFRAAPSAVDDAHTTTGLDIEQVPMAVDRARYDLTLSVSDDPEGMGLALEYRTALFDTSTAERLLRHLTRLLGAAVGEPDRPLADLPMLEDQERQQLLAVDPPVPFPEDLAPTLHGAFEAVASRQGDRVVAIHGENRWTYRELAVQAHRLSHRLIAAGVGRGDRVALAVDRSFHMLEGLLGILGAGAAWVPVDPALPPRRRSFLIDDSGAVAVVTTRGVVEDLQAAHGHPLPSPILLDGPESPGDWPETPPRVEVGAHDAACVLYTSGSTGVPKGAVGEHRSFLNRCVWMWRHYPFEDGEVCCQKTFLSFTDSVWEIFGPLLRGVPTVIVPDDVVRQPEALVALLEEHRVSRLVLVPMLLQALLDHEPELGSRVPSLRLWSVSGEALPSALTRRFVQQVHRVSGARLLNIYGSTEVAADITWHEVKAPTEGAIEPVGRALDNARIQLLGPDLEPVPPGARGMIWAGGWGLAQGYLGRPAWTAAAFVPDPFSTEPGERLYRTGDLGRKRRDGSLEFLGRADHQVKVLGVRIELGEVESALGELPGIRRAVVLARDRGGSGQELVAYLLLDDTVVGDAEDALEPYAAELRSALGEFLPATMIPAEMLVVDTLPTTASGKVDRLALARVGGRRLEQRETFVPPKTETERDLATLWSELLGREQIGSQDGFFDLGGHSLLATQLMVRIQETFGVEVPLREFFTHSSLEAMAREIDTRLVAEADPEELENLLEGLEGLDELDASDLERLLQGQSNE